MTRFCLIGPTYPYRGGIAHYTTLLAEHLREEHETLLISFSRQYPAWLFPGRSDRDPSERPLLHSLFGPGHSHFHELFGFGPGDKDGGCDDEI